MLKLSLVAVEALVCVCVCVWSSSVVKNSANFVIFKYVRANNN